MKYHIDLKFVYEAIDDNETQIQLKETLKQIIDKPGLDIFLRDPGSRRYDRVRR